MSREYQKLTDDQSIYSTVVVKIPTPKFIVFYNGTKEIPETMYLKLSDSYYTDEKNPDLELKVTMLNINSGKNRKILDSCKTLKEYMLYIERVRKYLSFPDMNLEAAVERAVNECINENILADFLRRNRAEAISMNIFEFDEREKELLRRADYNAGMEFGRKAGLITGIELVNTLLKNGRAEDIPKIMQDASYREKLIEKYGLSVNASF